MAIPLIQVSFIHISGLNIRTGLKYTLQIVLRGAIKSWEIMHSSSWSNILSSGNASCQFPTP
jgi:hypothetical protein